MDIISESTSANNTFPAADPPSPADAALAPAAGTPTERFTAVNGSTEGADPDPRNWGIWDRDAGGGNGDFITNFTLVFTEDVEVQDDLESRRTFRGTLSLLGRRLPFEIGSDDFAGNESFRARVYAVAGPEAEIRCGMDLLRRAVSAVSAGRAEPRRTTTNFGWDPGGDSYLVPGGRVTAAGLQPLDPAAGPDVDLAGEELARNLGLLAPPGPDELARLKRHVVEDLLALHDRRVTFALLGAAGAAALYRFAAGANRFALWLTGLTGSGKSYLAKLFQNFFGDFPVSSGAFAAWSSTPNYLQRQGYFFKDALYLVDDYKPEVIPPYQVTRVLQNYADGTGRGRLRADATTNTTRAIRGLLVSTGEDVPEHTASAVARSVIVPVPQRPKDLGRGARCVRECRNYRALTADFLRWFLAGGRAGGFGRRLRNLERSFYRDVAGEQNDARIAANFALLAAGFLELASYLGDAWPGWKKEAGRFVGRELRSLRDDMLGTVKEQQPSERFLATLGELYAHGRVRFQGPRPAADDERHVPVIGRRLALAGVTVLQVSTALALEQVQESLRRQGKPPLQVTERALLAQLQQDGRLVDETGNPLTAAGRPALTRRVRLDGRRQYCFCLPAATLNDQLGARMRVGATLRPTKPRAVTAGVGQGGGAR